MEAKVPSPTLPDLLTRKEAAAKLKISLPSVDKLISQNKLPSINVGRRRLIETGKLNDFIKNGGSK